MKLLCSLALIAALTTSLAAQDAKIMNLEQIIVYCDSSKTPYRIQTVRPGDSLLSDPFVVLYPQPERTLEYVKLSIDAEGRSGYGPYPLTEPMKAAIRNGDQHFFDSRYADARREYMALIEADPTFYLGYTYVGQTYRNENDPLRALLYFDSTIALVPQYYQGYFFRGGAMRTLGRLDEARQAYVKALARHPRHMPTYIAIRTSGDELGFSVRDTLFVPQAVADMIGDTARAIVDISRGNSAAWVAYGLAKAIWLAEPSHRKELNGSEKRSAWTSIEEIECVGALLNTYASHIEKEPADRDPRLDHLVSIVKAGYFVEFLIYELGSRVNPQIMLLQDEARRKRMEEFVDLFVLTGGSK